jgi:hypothetical protein
LRWAGIQRHVSRNRQPNNDLKVENMNKKLNSVPSAETAAEKRTIVDVYSFSQSIAKPHVSGISICLYRHSKLTFIQEFLF